MFAPSSSVRVLNSKRTKFTLPLYLVIQGELVVVVFMWAGELTNQQFHSILVLSPASQKDRRIAIHTAAGDIHFQLGLCCLSSTTLSLPSSPT